MTQIVNMELNYIEDNYIGRYNSAGQRQKPLFANERWDCCDRIKKDYARTNKKQIRQRLEQ